MKLLELTQEQCNKLLEMCRKLFPEYKEILWNSTNTDVPIFPDNDKNIKYENRWSIDNNLIHFSEKKSWDDENNYIIEIHWFEFCINWLAKEIGKQWIPINANSDEGLYEFLEQFHNKLIKENHPVDYLYEQFKELS